MLESRRTHRNLDSWRLGETFTFLAVSDWRSKLTKEKRERLMKVARKSKKFQAEKYKNTKQQILEERAQKMNEKLQEKKRKERESRTLKESLHNEIEKVGLWKTGNEIREKVKNISGTGKKREMLWLQIRFRNKVLGNTHEDKRVFQLTSEGKSFSVEQLIKNLISIINSANDDKEVDKNVESNTDKVMILNKDDFLKEKEKYLQKATITSEKAASKKKRKQTSQRKSGKKRKVDESVDKFLPVVSCAEELIGKRICLRFLNESGQERWYYGTVFVM